MSMHFALVALYVVTALLLLEGLSALIRGRRDPARVRKRLEKIQKRMVRNETNRSMVRTRASRRGFDSESLERLLYQAGSGMTVPRFLITSAAVAAGGFVAATMIAGNPVRALPLLLLGLLPWVMVRRAAERRRRAFEEQLPEALELLTRSLRTGHALGAGFQMVGEELPDPVGTEFGTVAEEIRLGLDVREALENLMRRVNNDDLPYFATAVLIQRQTGGNLAELLDKLGNLLRERIQFNGRVRAMTAQGRGAATFLALWLPGIIGIVWLVAPGYLRPLFETSLGLMVLAAAFAVDGLAYFLSLRIANVEA